MICNHTSLFFCISFHPHYTLATLSMFSSDPLSCKHSRVMVPRRPWSGEKRYVKGDLVMHRGRVHECATQSCSLEPLSLFSNTSCALFSQPLVILNAATGVLAIAIAILLWLVRHPHTRRLPPAAPPFQPISAGFHVSVLDSKLGCCAFALWNSCVASEAAAAGYVISRCFC